MLQLVRAQRLETLITHLAARLSTKPLGPFTTELFLVSHPGVARWLSQQLALQLTVFANAQLVSPGQFFTSLTERLLKQSVSAPLGDFSTLVWLLEQQLRQLDSLENQVIQQYLNGEQQALKRLQLAQQLAELFIRYQVLRPEMLDCWSQDRSYYADKPEEHWQRKLWLALIRNHDMQPQGSLYQAAITQLNTKPKKFFAGRLPERLFIIGLHGLSPLLLDYMQALTQHCDGELLLVTAGAFNKICHPNLNSASKTNNHPLLASLAQQERDWSALLACYPTINSIALTETQQSHNALQTLQQAVWSNQWPKYPKLDKSISVHACHSMMREVEVLKNLVFAALEQDSGLELSDIMVMAPDIEVYIPFITAVFAQVPHSIADRSPRVQHWTVDIFIRFLQVSSGRFGWQAVVDLLTEPLVYRSFALTAEDVDLLKVWIAKTEVRWGKSADHKQALNLPPVAQNTWHAALERLFMGYAVGSDAEFVLEVLPFIDLEGSSTQALGGLYDFLQLLFAASETLQQARSFALWHQQLSAYAEQLLAAATPLERQPLEALLNTLVDSLAPLHNAPLELSALIAWLEMQSTKAHGAEGFCRGQLTFASLIPQRVVPCKVIALLGMHESAFPRNNVRPPFDLLHQETRAGDPCQRNSDRYLFLELLLAARQQLIITYIGQSIQHNQPLTPAVVVSELLEALAPFEQQAALITLHPLQAFSPCYFTANQALINFNAADYATACALSAQKPACTAWWQGKIGVPQSNVLELNELLRFFNHPQRYFFQRQLGIRFSGIEQVLPETEPFILEQLTYYQFQQRWISARLNNERLELKKLQAQGYWPPASFGAVCFEQAIQELDAFVATIQAQALGAKQQNLPVDSQIGSLRLQGTLTGQYAQGQLLYRYAPLKGRDFLLAWLQHLVLNQVQPGSYTYLFAQDQTYILQPEFINADDLAHWLAIYQQGVQQPEAFFVECAFAYVKQFTKTQQASLALQAALECLTKALETTYEPELQRLYAQRQDLSLVLDQVFERHCQTLWVPIWQTLQV